jgi:hypothetical protein
MNWDAIVDIIVLTLFLGMGVILVCVMAHNKKLYEELRKLRTENAAHQTDNTNLRHTIRFLSESTAAQES